jgi:hypothetical protein
MGAEGREAVWGRGLHLRDVSLRIAAAYFVDLDIHEVTRDALFDEEDFSVHVRETVAFRGCRLDFNVFQMRFLLSAHFGPELYSKYNQRFLYI